MRIKQLVAAAALAFITSAVVAPAAASAAAPTHTASTANLLAAAPTSQCRDSSYTWSAYSAGTFGPGTFCLSSGGVRTIFQSDGNFVHYINGRAVAASGTNGRNAGQLAFQGDGNMVIYDRSGRAIWASGTNLGPQNQFRMIACQGDGNLVIYNMFGGRGVPMWATGTFR